MFDSRDLWESLYRYVMTMPYNLDLYDGMVIFGFLPRFHPGDLVRNRGQEGIYRVERVICDLWDSFSYEALQYDAKKHSERCIFREEEFELVGTADDMEINLLGSKGDIIDQVSVSRLKRLFEQVFGDFLLPEGSFLENNASGDWFAGYGMSTISAMIRSTKQDWDADAHRGETRFHLKKAHTGGYSATLWWKFGSVYYSYHYDLFELYRSTPSLSRFIYGDTPGEVLKKSAQTIRMVLNRFESEKSELLAKVQSKIDTHKSMSA
jgi:hypothetical protein